MIRRRLVRVTLLSLALAPAGGAYAQWQYRAGEQREQQQANFCDSVEDVSEIAELFERFGARTGFSALSASSSCSTGSRTFTPVRLEREVVLRLDSGGTYSVRFIQVQLTDGKTSYVVTTRRFDPDQ